MDAKDILEIGIQKEIISHEQKDKLLELIATANESSKEKSLVVKVLYYLGGFMVFCAMVSLMSQTIQNSTYASILSLGVLYALIFFGIGELLWRKNEKLPAGILYFLFVVAFSLIVMDIEKMTGFFPHFADINKYPNYFELCRFPILVLAGTTAIISFWLQKIRNTDFLSIPLIGCAYAIYMVILHFIFNDEILDELASAYCHFVFSLGLFVVAFSKDRVAKVDYSKWMYLFSAVGMISMLMLILSASYVPEKVFQFVLFIMSIIYCTIGMLIQRKIFSIIGILGIIEYLLYLEIKYITGNTMLLTSCMIITGLLVLYAGVLYNKNSDKIAQFIIGKLPKTLKEHMPQNRT